MSSESAEYGENICIVCFKNVDIYSVGNCDHMVCYECSTRMRVLCRQNECPICRQDLPKVVFSRVLKPFGDIANSSPYEDKKYKIEFQDKKIQDSFYKLLEHCCSVCPNRIFRTFQQLYDHMRKDHELYYCDLCVEHLRIFTSERRCYNKSDLSLHRRKGDPDDRSHRGHPLCEFCQIRFLDNDFLYRHLRKDHLFCHFCDADGQDLYYSSYDYLRDHFREEHYLCEEGTCIDEKFTPVFRTEIDLKAHRMSVHGKTMGKAAAKQVRTLELEFTLKPRPRQQESSRKGKSTRFDASSAVEGTYDEDPPTPPSKTRSKTLDPSEFPSLPSGSGSVTVSSTQHRGRVGALTIQTMGRRNAPLAITDENFPALREHSDSAQGTSVRLNINQDRSGNISRSGSVITPRNVSIHVNHRSNGEQNIRITQDDFPALTSNQNITPVPSNWGSVVNKKSLDSSAKAESQSVNTLQDGDFPSLNTKINTNLKIKLNEAIKPHYVNIRSGKGEGKNTKKATSVIIPVVEDGSNTAEASTSSLKSKVKKKKSKGNNSEEKADTAKKKIDNESSHNNIKEPKKLNSRALSETTKNSSSNDNSRNSNSKKLSKPLPTAEDWFGDCKKNQKVKSVQEAEVKHDGSQSLNRKANQQGTKMKKNSEPGTSTVGKLTPKKESKAPPGFDLVNNNAKIKDSSKPPPGFTFDFPRSNGLTFTNSSGQSFAIQTNYNYTPPLNFEIRNQTLVNKVFHILLNETNLEQFKKMSALFRQDALSAEDYCNQCIKTMGEDGFREVFPELLILLPDINKQQELYQVFLRSPKFDFEKTQLTTCETCRQVLCSSDIKEHLAQHSLQDNFPLLMPNAWTK